MSTHASSVFGTSVCKPFLGAPPSPGETALATPATGNGPGAYLVHPVSLAPANRNMPVYTPCPSCCVGTIGTIAATNGGCPRYGTVRLAEASAACGATGEQSLGPQTRSAYCSNFRMSIWPTRGLVRARTGVFRVDVVSQGSPSGRLWLI